MKTQAIDWHARAKDLRPDGRAFIGGRRMAAASGESFESRSPLDGRLLGSVARGRAADIDAAAVAARSAFDDGRWARRAPAQRKKVLLAWAERLLAAKEELALLETLDMGKPIRYALAVDVPAASAGPSFHAAMIIG